VLENSLEFFAPKEKQLQADEFRYRAMNVP